MKLVRNVIENLFLPLVKMIFFTKDTSGETAHKFMIFTAKKMKFFGVTKFFLQDLSISQNYILSNAAGWDKDAQIGNDFFQYLGFQRIVLGSVTAESYRGNQVSVRSKRLTKQKSMLNWLGLPNQGAKKLAKTLSKEKFFLPITINIAPLPTSNDPCYSILKTMNILQNFGDRWEINLSCPNIKEQNSWQELAEIVQKVSKNRKNKQLYWKISPQWNKNELEKFLKICTNFEFSGFTAGNSSAIHDYNPNPNYKGALSGELLFSQSYQLVKNLWKLIQEKYIHKNWKIIACGGISKHKELCFYKNNFGIEEFQVYTAFIFQGPKIIKNLQNGN